MKKLLTLLLCGFSILNLAAAGGPAAVNQQAPVDQAAYEALVKRFSKKDETAASQMYTLVRADGTGARTYTCHATSMRTKILLQATKRSTTPNGLPDYLFLYQGSSGQTAEETSMPPTLIPLDEQLTSDTMEKINALYLKQITFMQSSQSETLHLIHHGYAENDALAEIQRLHRRGINHMKQITLTEAKALECIADINQMPVAPTPPPIPVPAPVPTPSGSTSLPITSSAPIAKTSNGKFIAASGAGLSGAGFLVLAVKQHRTIKDLEEKKQIYRLTKAEQEALESLKKSRLLFGILGAMLLGGGSLGLYVGSEK